MHSTRCPDCGDMIEVFDDGMRTLCGCDTTE